MFSSSPVPIFCLVVAISLPQAYAWGAAGHQIVATIAQMYLHPKVLPTLCDILDLPSDRCHLASVATWADQQRIHMRWSAALHYIGAVDDYPSRTCAFPGEHNWKGRPMINALDAIRNTTSLLQGWVNNDDDTSNTVANEALKFLIHFVGDMHQPLHLTGRDRGGNSVHVLFDRRHTNLHSVWDTLLVAKAIRTVPRNYSRPLPYPKIESAFQGAIYDPYIRRIMYEGVLQAWKDGISNWLVCPSPITTDNAATASGLMGFWSAAFIAVRRAMQSVSMTLNPKMGVEITPDGPIICPHFWAQPVHQLNCEIAWPPELDAMFSDTDSPADKPDLDIPLSEEKFDSDIPTSLAENTPLLQLDSPQYSGLIARRMIVESLLAQGGIRLAGILNYIFAQTSGQGLFVVGIND